MNAIIKWCRKKSKPVLVDCSDWMPFSCESFLRHIVKWLDVNYQNKVIPKRADGVVVVSSYIDNLFKSRNCRTMLVPHVFDCAEMDACRRTYPYSSGSVRRFVYTGIPFQVGTKTPKSHFKDRLDRSIELFYHLFKKGYKFRFDIYGLTAENYLYTVPEHASILAEMESCVVFHGLCPSNTIIEAICTADMVILNRDDTLVTRAGFPTKVAEAMALGTPVITEPTSNIADYIKHGVNGFLFDPSSEEQQMEQIMDLSDAEIQKLRKNCIDDPQFDYKKYVDCFAAIFK
jgi:glycosyltransferase involved in cell wall biosynthesis